MQVQCCLIDAIKQNGMSCEEIAAKLDLSVAHLEKIDRGDFRALRKSTIVGICEAMDCQIGDFLKVVHD